MTELTENPNDPPSVVNRIVSVVRICLGLHLDVVLPVYYQTKGSIGVPLWYGDYGFKLVGYRGDRGE